MSPKKDGRLCEPQREGGLGRHGGRILRVRVNVDARAWPPLAGNPKTHPASPHRQLHRHALKLSVHAFSPCTSTIQAPALLASVAAEKVIIVNVGGNTDDAGKVFQPQSVAADQGDVVYFNFTQGNHTVTQSLFDSPCLATYVSNFTVNGFNSGFRDAGNGSTYSDLLITILDPNTPLWFFDFNTCALGGVGVINPDSTQTLQEFQDKAMTVNGTGPHHSSSVSMAASATKSSATPDKTRASSGATQPIAAGANAVVPLAVLALSLSLLS